MFNKIQNPQTGNWVNIHGPTGKKVLRNYVQIGSGECFDRDIEAADIIEKRRADMTEMRSLFPDDRHRDRWSLQINDPIYFAGDKVMIVHERVACSRGYSNAVGTIIDPRSINQGTCIYGCGEYPDQINPRFRRRNTFRFKYTTKYGQAIRILNSSEVDIEDENYAEFLDYIENEAARGRVRLKSYMETMGTAAAGPVAEYNKTTDNEHDLSFLSAIDEGATPNKAKYLVEWETTDDSGHKMQVITFAEDLKLYAARL